VLRVPAAFGSVVVAVALLASGISASAQSARSVNIAVLGNTDSSAEPIYADAAGILKKHGLDAKLSQFNGGGAIVAAIAGGSIDIGETNTVSAAAALQRGIPIVVVAPSALFTSREPDVLLVKARGAALRTGADLNGKTVAVTTLRGELQVGAETWIDKNGGDSKTVRFVEVPTSGMAAALKQGRIDAAMLPEPELTIAKGDVEKLGDAFGAIAPSFDLGVFVASKPWAEKNPDLVRRFVSAMVDTAHWANAHHAETAAVLAQRSKLAPETIRTMGRSLYGDTLSAALLQPPIDAAFHYGTLRERFDAARFVSDAAPYWTDARKS
jgi:NitT/TauT family transport system substrate-binding protein